MPYKEKYPLNPTPQGDSTKDDWECAFRTIKRRWERSSAAHFIREKQRREV